MRFFSTRLAAGVAITALAAGVFPSGSRVGLGATGFGPAEAHAQNIGQRVVYGFVIDPDAKPISGATVFLKYLKTKSIRSYTTEADGKFRFTQVNMAEDYELWAEKDGKKTAVKTVSQWDARKDFESDLKLK